MCAYAQAVAASSSEYLFRLSKSKRPALTENVHEAGEVLFCYPRNNLLADQFNIVIFFAFELRRDHVRGKKRGNHSSRPPTRSAANGFKRFDFGRGVQAVTRFGFDRGCALLQHGVECSLDFLNKLSA